MGPKTVQSSTKVAKKGCQYYCESCDYTTSRKNNYNKHILTKKHIENMGPNGVQSSTKVASIYICENCDKEYQTRGGLRKHKKKCKNENAFTPELAKEIMKLAGTTNNINKQINNNININLFLNEHCKNALNLSDFVDNIKLQLEDVLQTHNLGSIEDGTTNIILNQLNDISMNERPIHCSDKKRKKFYIKENDTWKKEDGKKIGDVVDKIQIDHLKALKEWEDLHPHYMDVGHKDNNTWQRMLNTLTSPLTEKKKEKVIKEIASQVSLKDAMSEIKS